MKQAWWFLAGCMLATAQSASNIDVSKVTHGIEKRYNNIKTLQVNFTQVRTDKSGRRTFTGTLYLQKPRKMRWEYTAPAGQFYLSDGQFNYDYDPKNNQVERCKFKDGDDVRGPLALLLGKVDFDRDFGSYTTGSPDGAITATPKSDNQLYSEIAFVAAPDFSIKMLSIKGQDGSTTKFTFDGETANPPLKDSLFVFSKPPGAVVSDCGKQ